MNEAFEKANKEWKSELLLRVAHEIIYTSDDDVPEQCKAPLVVMKNGYLQVNSSLSPSFYD